MDTILDKLSTSNSEEAEHMRNAINGISDAIRAGYTVDEVREQYSTDYYWQHACSLFERGMIDPNNPLSIPSVRFALISGAISKSEKREDSKINAAYEKLGKSLFSASKKDVT